MNRTPLAPLWGLPHTKFIKGRGQTQFGPHAEARELAAEYMATHRFKYDPITVFTPVDVQRARRIAHEYDKMGRDPSNPAVMASYRALINETAVQYEYFLKSGVQVDFVPEGAIPPYPSVAYVIFDVIENKHLWASKTAPGAYGPDDSEFEEPNLMLEPMKYRIGDVVLLANDLFRIVHDYFGHVKEGVLFDFDGEENAWRGHSTMYTRDALGAMTTELRGQNSWTNFGPYGNYNRSASQIKTKYAPQKNNLMPEWVWDEGRKDP